VAGHLTIFLTRTRGPFWSIRPAKILLIAVVGTQTIATLIAVYGIFMAPLGWKWAGFVWAYAIVWALINDRVKLLAYRIFRSDQEGDPANRSARRRYSADRDSAYEIYQERVHGESQQDQDWLEAERETRKDEVNMRRLSNRPCECSKGRLQLRIALAVESAWQ